MMPPPAPVPEPTAELPPPSPTIVAEQTAVATAAAVAAANAVPVGTVLQQDTFAKRVDLSDGTVETSPIPSASPASKSSKSKKKKSQVTVTMATAITAQANGHGLQGENTGRWTAEEHRLFLQGLEQHGKGWKKIASLIKSRTVVQIRTHAQKYFQKLSKARQNGEEGEISMEGRGGQTSAPSVTTSVAQSSKRRRLATGTKRKAIQSVVSSAQRHGKKIASAQAVTGAMQPMPTMPSLAPALAPYVLPSATDTQPGITAAQGSLSSAALEDSLFRFLTPAPIVLSEPQVNEVARQAGANPITVPTEHPGYTPSINGGDVSPTGVAEFSLYPSWTDAKDTPSWYAKGSDVDALLDVADTLDWLTDTGDLTEIYQQENPTFESVPEITDMSSDNNPVGTLSHTPSVNNMSMNTLPRVDSTTGVDVPELPSLFGSAAETDDPSRKLSMQQLASSASSATIDEHLQVFENDPDDLEHDFVSSMLDNAGESSGNLVDLQ